jgi:molybdopterin converting factor small subunit
MRSAGESASGSSKKKTSFPRRRESSFDACANASPKLDPRLRGDDVEQSRRSPVRITVECYGASQRWCGAELLSLDLVEAARVTDALDQLAERYPDFASRRETVAVAIGDEIVAASRALAEGERIALIPPVSGG